MTELNNDPLNQSAIARLLEARMSREEISHGQLPTMAVLRLAMLGLDENDLDGHNAIQAARRNQPLTLERLSEELDAEELAEGTPEDAALMVRNILSSARIRV